MWEMMGVGGGRSIREQGEDTCQALTSAGPLVRPCQLGGEGEGAGPVIYWVSQTRV